MAFQPTVTVSPQGSATVSVTLDHTEPYYGGTKYVYNVVATTIKPRQVFDGVTGDYMGVVSYFDRENTRDPGGFARGTIATIDGNTGHPEDDVIGTYVLNFTDNSAHPFHPHPATISIDPPEAATLGDVVLVGGEPSEYWFVDVYLYRHYLTVNDGWEPDTRYCVESYSGDYSYKNGPLENAEKNTSYIRTDDKGDYVNTDYYDGWKSGANAIDSVNDANCVVHFKRKAPPYSGDNKISCWPNGKICCSPIGKIQYNPMSSS